MLENLTIITAARDASAYIPGYLKNVYPLLDMGCKIAFIDDFSDDGSLELVGERPHKNLRAIRNPEHYGPGKSRNEVLKNLDTKYFTVMDVDDWIDISRFVKTYEYIASHENVDCVRVGHIKVVGKNRTICPVPTKSFFKPLAREEQVGRRDKQAIVDYPFSCAGMYKTEPILKENILYDETDTCEDRIFFWKMAMSDLTVVALPYLYYFYSRDPNPQANTQRVDERQLAFIDAYIHMREYMRENGDENSVHKFNRQMLAIIEHHLNKRELYSGKLQKRLLEGCAALIKGLPESERKLLISEANAKRKEMISSFANY